MNEQKVRVFVRFISIIVVLSALLAYGTLSADSTTTEPGPTPTPGSAPGFAGPRGRPVSPSHVLNPSSAPGYCSSTGGDTSYESISGVTLTTNPDGTIKLTVQVYIANPTGCTAGQPCPEYDYSPEYVNVWIDWDGDKKWEASEKVMDKALTGYLAINYGGTMTAVSQFSSPAPNILTDKPTWLRANLGWAYDPNNPCESSWTWGNVLDKQVHVAKPKIEKIIVQGVGTTNKKPEAGSKVRLEADIKVPTGYQVTKCTWTGTGVPSPKKGVVVDPAKKCRYEYTPAKGSGPAANRYGAKEVTLTITYKHTASGASGQASKKHKYKVYFKKAGDDDTDGDPNWFEYWKRALGLDGNVSYRAGVNWGSTDFTPHVYIGSNAGSGPDPRHAKTGIDCFYCVTTHELQHYADILHCNTTYGGITTIPAANDTDGDRLPNELDPFPNTVNGAGYAEYTGANAWRGDWERNARQVENVVAAANLDWANPGKQASVDPNPLGHVPSAQIGLMPFHTEGWGLGYDDSNLAQAEFTGSYSDYGTDLDADGQHNNLTLDAQLDVSAAGDVIVIGGLESGESTIWAETTTYLGVGTHWVTLNFAGESIYQQRENGPYSVSLVIDLEDWLSTEYVTDTYTTSAYSYTDFEHPGVVLTGSYTDAGMDTGSDSLYDLLRINVGLDVQEAGTYTVTGELEGSDSIAVAGTTASLSTGGQTIDLDFGGQLIFQQRKDGPYHLRKLRIEDASGSQIDFIYDAYTTAAYTYGQFQHGGTTIDAASYSDQGLDVDSDGDYDYLRVEFQVNVDQEGTYRLLAALSDSEGETIASIIQDMELTIGSNAISLDFPGGDISEHGVDGPYQVASVALLDADGTVADCQQIAHTTQAYGYADFSPPLISLTGGYHDYVQDIDGNGLYDYLNIDISVIPGDAGVIVAQGRLVDSTGQEIEWAEKNTQMDADTAQVITLSFAGKVIFANGRNGPFELRALLVYHTGDPGQGVFVSQAHATTAYSYLDFEWLRLYLPLILR